LAWAIGVPVASGRELVAELSLGADARLRGHAEAGWTRLTGASSGLAGPLVLGVSGNYLMFGSRLAAVRTLAPWVARRVGTAALAPELPEPGIGARLFASGLALQALHAHWSAVWRLSALPWLDSLDAGLVKRQLAHVEALVHERLSAYLGALRGGDVLIRWEGEDVSARGDFSLGRLPEPSKTPSACHEVAGLPASVRFWVAGTDERSSNGAPQSGGPDWDSNPGVWQKALFDGFTALAAAFDGRVALADAALTDGSWVVGWHEQRGASAALAVLRGIPFEAVIATPPVARTREGSRLQAKTTDGKVLEWAWAARGSGIVTAFGAKLGHDWDAWVHAAPTTGWPRGLSPQACEGLVLAAGTDRGTFFSISRVHAELRVRAELDLSTLGGWVR